MAVVFSKQRFDFACKTIEQLKNIPKPEQWKVRLLGSMYWRCGAKKKILSTKSRKMRNFFALTESRLRADALSRNWTWHNTQTDINQAMKLINWLILLYFAIS